MAGGQYKHTVSQIYFHTNWFYIFNEIVITDQNKSPITVLSLDLIIHTKEWIEKVYHGYNYILWFTHRITIFKNITNL